MSPFVIALAALLVVAWLVAPPFIAQQRRRKLRESSFPAAWRDILERRVPLFRRLPFHLQRELEQHTQVFIAEKTFTGCGGVVIDDEVRVMIAAQACLLILNRPTGYFPKLRQILVYPSAFIVERVRPEPSGVLQEQRQVLAGESWTNGQVVISLDDAVEGAAISDDGRNVVIHEFAHQLDQEKGYANGAPVLPGRERYARWSRVLGGEFGRLRSEASMQVPTLLSYYGATDPAEFFAVATEVFFEQPQQMALMHGGLYEELRAFYCVDPASWAGAH